MMYKKMMLICVLVFSFSSSAMATSKSPSSCAALGAIEVKCYQCRGEKKYLGKAAVMAAYEEDKGEKFCVRVADAKSACASVFGVDRSSIGFKAEFWIGLTKSTEKYNKSCVETVGH